jgi:hypothetical protein
MNYPLKKKYEQDFLTENWKGLFTLKYEQATIWEYYEYLALSDEEKFYSLYQIVRSQIPKTLLDKIGLFFFDSLVLQYEKGIDIPLVIQNIAINRFRTSKSIFENNEKSKFLPSAWLSIVCLEFNLSPSELFANHTLEQFTFFIDGIIYKSNEQTKEGKSKNKWATRDKIWARERAKLTREAFGEL